MGFLSDGSIIAAGQATDNGVTVNSQQSWLLHLDSTGCLPDSNSCGIISSVADIPQSAGSIRAYPVPAQDHMTIDYQLSDPTHPATLIIIDAMGQSLYTTTLPDSHGTTTLDTRTWPTGLYLYRLLSHSGLSSSGTFLITH